jgi:hypothetical protein
LKASFFLPLTGRAAVPEFTITLTDEQAGQLRELVDYWGDSLQEALRRIAMRGIDLELQVKAHDEREAAGLPHDQDDGIPF